MRSLHLIDTPRFIANDRSNRCVHFSLNYFALREAHLYFSTTSRVKLLFVNAYVNTFAHKISYAMNKPKRFSAVIHKGTVALSRPAWKLWLK